MDEKLTSELNDETFAIKLLTEKKIKEEVAFTCNNKDFMEEFGEMLFKFYNEYEGKIFIDKEQETPSIKRYVIK